jgi:hypothetical protein
MLTDTQALDLQLRIRRETERQHELEASAGDPETKALRRGTARGLDLAAAYLREVQEKRR